MEICRAGTEVKVRHIIGETVLDVSKCLANGNLYFVKDAYVEGETCRNGFYHLRQARELLPKKLGDNVKKWPRLRKACHTAGIRRINIPGGDIPIHYRDEIVVPDYAVSGSHYFIVPKRNIGELLSYVPLDEAGKRLRQVFKEREEYQKYAPEVKLQKIVGYLWHDCGYHNMPKGTEFIKFIVESWQEEKRSIIFPQKTDIAHPKACNVPKIEVEGKDFYLSGWEAGKIDPRNHHRVKREYIHAWGRCVAYLLPPPGSADVVTDDDRWSNLFDTDKYESDFPKSLIVTSKKLIVELYNISDELIERRELYIPEIIGTGREAIV